MSSSLDIAGRRSQSCFSDKLTHSETNSNEFKPRLSKKTEATLFLGLNLYLWCNWKHKGLPIPKSKFKS